MKKKYDIHQLAVVPYIIAERAAWNILERKHKALTPAQCNKIVEQLSPVLVKFSEHYFQNSPHFRTGMLNKRNDEREYLEMFMEHWTLGLIKKGKIKKYLTN
jgi:hypothetical protein